MRSKASSPPSAAAMPAACTASCRSCCPTRAAMHEGVELPTAARSRSSSIPTSSMPNRRSPAMDRLRARFSRICTKKDNRIIAAALFVQERYPPPTILVTKDVNVQLKARAVGLESEDYLNDKVPEVDEEASYREIPVNIYELQRFCSEGEFEVDAEVARSRFISTNTSCCARTRARRCRRATMATASCAG